MIEFILIKRSLEQHCKGKDAINVACLREFLDVGLLGTHNILSAAIGALVERAG